MELINLLLHWTTRVDKILATVEPGDLICFHRSIFIHHAVYVGKERTVHHHIGDTSGEVIEVPLEYLAKGDLMRIIPVNGSPYSRQEIVRRARSKIGPRPYSLHAYNCEHFTNWVYFGVEISGQIDKLSRYEVQLLTMVQPSSRQEQEEKKLKKKAKRKQAKMKGAKANSTPETEQLQQTIESLSCQSNSPAAQHEIMPQSCKPKRQSGQSSDPLADQKHLQDGGPEKFSKQRDASNYKTTDEKVTDDVDEGEDDDYVFVPPRPVKYKPASNCASLALNHARSWAQVATVRSLMALASVQFRRTSDMVECARKLQRKLSD